MQLLHYINVFIVKCEFREVYNEESTESMTNN